MKKRKAKHSVKGAKTCPEKQKRKGGVNSNPSTKQAMENPSRIVTQVKSHERSIRNRKNEKKRKRAAPI